MLRRRLSYAASEVAGQLVFCVISFYLLKFYTDVYGISTVSAGFILLATRVLDAIDAPLWGVVFDRVKSRLGRSRPWFLWLSGPFALFGVLTFTTTSVSGMAKVMYAAVTYGCCSILYTGINTPVTSILVNLTSDSGERVTLTTFRMFGSKFAVLFVNLTVLGLVARLGRGNAQRGFLLTMVLYGLCSLVLYLLAFRNLKEEVVPERKMITLRDSLRAVRGNRPWLIIVVSSFFFWIAFIARISTAPYFFEYVLYRKDLISLANSLDFLSLGTVMFLPYLCAKTSKSSVWMAGLIGCFAAQLLTGLGVWMGSVALVVSGWALGFFASGAAMAMPFSLLSDSVDYGEWKCGVRAQGFLTAIGAAFCLKAGSGFGSALPAWILHAFAYVPNVEQTPRAITGIVMSFVWLPAVSYAIAVLPVFFYDGYEHMESRIRIELESRRAASMPISMNI